MFNPTNNEITCCVGLANRGYERVTAARRRTLRTKEGSPMGPQMRATQAILKVTEVFIWGQIIGAVIVLVVAAMIL